MRQRALSIGFVLVLALVVSLMSCGCELAHVNIGPLEVRLEAELHYPTWMPPRETEPVVVEMPPPR